MKLQVKSEPNRVTVGQKNTPKSTCDVVDENGNQAAAWFWGHKPIHDGDMIDVAEIKEDTYKGRTQHQILFAKGMYPDEGESSGGGGFGGNSGGGGFGSAPAASGFGSAPAGGGGFGGGSAPAQAPPAQAPAPAGYSVAPDKHADVLAALVKGCYLRMAEGQSKILSDLVASETNVAELLAREAFTSARTIYIALDRSGKLNSVSDAEIETLLSTIPF